MAEHFKFKVMKDINEKINEGLKESKKWYIKYLFNKFIYHLWLIFVFPFIIIYIWLTDGGLGK